MPPRLLRRQKVSLQLLVANTPFQAEKLPASEATQNTKARDGGRFSTSCLVLDPAVPVASTISQLHEAINSFLALSLLSGFLIFANKNPD